MFLCNKAIYWINKKILKILILKRFLNSKTKGDFKMSDKSPNQSIKCNVSNCKNHCNSQNYCSLNSVKIGTKDTNPMSCKCIDCESFEAKN